MRRNVRTANGREFSAAGEWGRAGFELTPVRRSFSAFLRCGWICLLLLLCACSQFAGAVVPPGFTPKVWQAQDGLTDETVQAFAQTADGYLWIGTTGGLVRFDGSHFTAFESGASKLFQNNGVFALLITRDGTLWIGTEGGGLVRYSAGVFKVFGAEAGLNDLFVRTLYEDHNGTLWVGTDDGLYQLRGERLERLDDRNGIPTIAVHALVEDHLGGLWVAGSRLLRIQGGRAKEYVLKADSFQISIKSILETQDHTIWVGTVAGLHRLVEGATNFERFGDLQVTVRSLRQTVDGSLWIGTVGQGIWVWKGGLFKQIVAPIPLPSNTVLSVLEDSDKNIWIGTQAGMLRLERTPVTIVALPDSEDSDFGTLFVDRDDSVWVVSTDVFRVRNGIAKAYVFPELGRIRARNIFRSKDGALWIGTDGDGVIRLAQGKVQRYTSKSGLVNNLPRSFLESRDGSIWVLTDSGVSHITKQGIVNFDQSNGLVFFSTRTALEDKVGDIWIGTERGLSHLHGDQFVHDTATRALEEEKIWSIHEDSDGGLWFGTRNNGLYRLKHEKMTHFTSAQGLPSDAIYQIVEDGIGSLWLSGPSGVALMDRHELDRIADASSSSRLSFTFFDVGGALQATQLYGGRQSSGALDSRGDVWFPSNKGPVHIGRSAVRQNDRLPPLVIREVKIDGRTLSKTNSVVIQPGQERLEISYDPVLLRSQEGIRFRYKLDGFDKGWIEASMARVASYTNLPSGRYTFRVQAFHANDPGTTVEATIGVEQMPHYYRTPWFLSLCLLAVVAVVVGLYRFRVWQIKMRFRAVFEERNRVAREMHDTVIQGCAGVSALIEGLCSLPADSRMPLDLLENARAMVRTTIDEARETVWGLRRNSLSEKVLATSLQRTAEEICRESAVQVVCEVEGKPFALSEFASHELIMITREAVFNAALHGESTKINILLAFTRKRLTLEIADDGIGFDPALVPTADDHHYGLQGMEERAHTIGATFALISNKQKGTQVRIQVSRRTSDMLNLRLGASHE